ncbi:14505_t:CDS:2, partial [Rhizophagus irregularis]
IRSTGSSSGAIYRVSSAWSNNDGCPYIMKSALKRAKTRDRPQPPTDFTLLLTSTALAMIKNYTYRQPSPSLQWLD